MKMEQTVGLFLLVIFLVIAAEAFAWLFVRDIASATSAVLTITVAILGVEVIEMRMKKR